MDNRTHPKATGTPFLVAGVAFLAIALATDHMTFIGAGLAFIALGIVLIGKARQDTGHA